ncbi:MAG: DUF2148 domain-containing protein [Clostridiales Family XIII bacterium]|nr:DUF2148 domain-containing protein [Clostridiales Family XIII bacterium]
MELDAIASRIVEYMAVSAVTAPKTKGTDSIGVQIVRGADIRRLADAMYAYGKAIGSEEKYNRDGKNIMDADAVLLFFIKPGTPAPGLNCGACGEERCADLQSVEGPMFPGPICAWRLMDLGIALGSAVKTASMFNVDNRIIHRIGPPARKSKMAEGSMVIGIPISITHKNIFFDRS